MPASRIPLVLLGLLVSGCGGGDAPARPTAPAPPGWAAGTTLTIVSSDDGQPVPAATVSMGGRTLTADGSGRLTLDAPAPDSTLMDVLAAGFFDRLTVVRSAEGTRITLWPKETAAGLTQHTTAELVYTPAASCCPASQLAGGVLHRVSPNIAAITLVLAAEYRGHAQTVAALRDAAALASAASGGSVRFSPADAPSGPTIEVTGGTDPLNRPLVAALAQRTFDARGYITGGRIVAVDPDFLTEGWSHVDTVTLLTHELGHMLGLEHSSAPGVMLSSDVVGAAYLFFRREGDYSAMEKQVVRLMAQRRALNRFPDNDRDVAATSERGDSIACR